MARGAPIRFRPGAVDSRHVGITYGWEQIAAYLNVSPRYAQRWHRRRPMPLVNIGGSWAVPKRALEEWILSRPLVEGSRYALRRTFTTCPSCGFEAWPERRQRPGN